MVCVSGEREKHEQREKQAASVSAASFDALGRVFSRVTAHVVCCDNHSVAVF